LTICLVSIVCAIFLSRGLSRVGCLARAHACHFCPRCEQNCTVPWFDSGSTVGYEFLIP
jgi:hypothetical protein